MQSRSYQCTSLDEGANILNREWSRHRLQVQKGESLRLRFSIRSLTPALSLSSLAYGANIQVTPEERADVLLLQMPCAGVGSASYAWGNTPLDSRHYALINVREVAQVHYGREVDMLVLRIGIPRIMAHLAHMLSRKPEANIVFKPRIDHGSEAWNAWLPVVAALEALQRNPQVVYPQASMDAMEAMVLSTLLMTQPSNYLEELRRPGRAPAPRHVRMAEEYIHTQLHRALTTHEIAEQAEVSVRTLFSGFCSFRGMTPKAYVRQARLDVARADLRSGAYSVAEVAKRLGFPHAGHFASQYRKHFGETPAETARLRSNMH